MWEAAHGLSPRQHRPQAGDLLNLGMSTELGGYWANNGGSLALEPDVHHPQPLVDASCQLLRQARQHPRGGGRLGELKRLIEQEAKRSNLNVIKNPERLGREPVVLPAAPQGVLATNSRSGH